MRTTAANAPVKPKKELKKEGKARRKATKASEKHGAGAVEVEWSVTADPTEGLTEHDLRLPAAPIDAALPPLAPMGEDEGRAPGDEAGAEDPHVAEGGLVTSFSSPPPPPPPPPGLPGGEPSTPVSADEPPQFLLRQTEIPELPDLPDVAPPPAPPLVETLPAGPGPDDALGHGDLPDPGPMLPPESLTPPPPPPTMSSPPGAAPSAFDDLNAIIPPPDVASAPHDTEPVPAPAPPFAAAPDAPALPRLEPAGFDTVAPDPHATDFAGTAEPAGEGAPPAFEPAFEPVFEQPTFEPREFDEPFPDAPAPEDTREEAALDEPATTVSPPPPPFSAPTRSSAPRPPAATPATPPLPPPPPPPPPPFTSRSRSAPPLIAPPVSVAPPPPPPPPPPAPAPAPSHATLDDDRPTSADPFDGLPPMPGFSGDTSPLPTAPLPPAAPPGTPDVPIEPPHIDVDQLFTADTPPVQKPQAGIPDAAAAWEHVNSGRPALRVRDLLADPDEVAPLPPPPPPPPRAEPSFFAPVTPEQLGEDPSPPPG